MPGASRQISRRPVADPLCPPSQDPRFQACELLDAHTLEPRARLRHCQPGLSKEKRVAAEGDPPRSAGVLEGVASSVKSFTQCASIGVGRWSLQGK